MPKVTFITQDGKEHELDAEEGVTLMEIGRDANLGIEGTCGGSLSCATCHVVVDPEWYEKTGEPDPDEEDMVDLAFGLEPTSRLGCQIRLDDNLNGLIIASTFFILLIAYKLLFLNFPLNSHNLF